MRGLSLFVVFLTAMLAVSPVFGEGLKDVLLAQAKLDSSLTAEKQAAYEQQIVDQANMFLGWNAGGMVKARYDVNVGRYVGEDNFIAILVPADITVREVAKMTGFDQYWDEGLRIYPWKSLSRSVLDFKAEKPYVVIIFLKKDDNESGEQLNLLEAMLFAYQAKLRKLERAFPVMTKKANFGLEYGVVTFSRGFNWNKDCQRGTRI